MNYSEILTNLKKLQRLESNLDFRQQSKMIILSTPPRLGFWSTIAEYVELGASVALGGFLIFVFLGGITNPGPVRPLQLSNLDIGGIKAEAEAIDIQIKLAEHAYLGLPLPIYQQTTTDALPPAITQSAIAPQPHGAATPPPPSPSIDEALRRLAE